MYLVGQVGCPHCLHRWEICVEVDAPPPPGQQIVIRCPNDNSAHRFSLAATFAVPECPPGVKAIRLEDFNEPSWPPEPDVRPARPWWRFWEW